MVRSLDLGRFALIFPSFAALRLCHSKTSSYCKRTPEKCRGGIAIRFTGRQTGIAAANPPDVSFLISQGPDRGSFFRTGFPVPWAPAALPYPPIMVSQKIVIDAASSLKRCRDCGR